MTLSAVATRYAHALAEAVTGRASALRPQDAARELRAFESVFASSWELRNALVTPSVPVGRKRAVVDRLAERLKLSRISRNFLCVLVDHRRIALLAEIVRSFERVIDERMGLATASVTSACELSETERASLNRQLQRITGRQVRAEYAVDPALIGGAVARIGSTVYDGSVRGQLASLRRRLSAESSA